jgi:hypothetical protein
MYIKTNAASLERNLKIVSPYRDIFHALLKSYFMIFHHRNKSNLWKRTLKMISETGTLIVGGVTKIIPYIQVLIENRNGSFREPILNL